jgi:type VI protein secretion system component VasA
MSCEVDKCETDKRAKVYTGSDKTLNFRLTDKVTKNPLDLTSATEIEVLFPVSDGGLPVSKKLTLSQVTITLAVAGKFSVALSAVDTARLEIGAAISIEVKVTIATKVSIIQIDDALNVIKSMF